MHDIEAVWGRFGY